MSERKWHAKPIYVMVALALVLSLGMTAVPWGSSEQVDAVIEPGQLVVEIMWPSGNGAWFCEGDSFVIAANLTNIGEETIENVTATLTIDANASTTDPIKSVGDIEAGQWKVVTWIVKCESGGDSAITVTADGNNTEPAFDTVTVWQFIFSPPNPSVEVYAPAQVCVGDDYYVTAVYNHFYEETVENVTATIVINGPASTTDSLTKAIGDIPAGESAEVTWNLTCTGAGGVNVLVTAVGTNIAADAAAIQQICPVWECPLDHVALIAPYLLNGRPFLSVSVDLSMVGYSVDWFQVLWLDESSGEWLTYHSKFTTGNTLTTLEPDEFYYVVVSEPCGLGVS